MGFYQKQSKVFLRNTRFGEFTFVKCEWLRKTNFAYY